MGRRTVPETSGTETVFVEWFTGVEKVLVVKIPFLRKRKQKVFYVKVHNHKTPSILPSGPPPDHRYV